MVLYNTYNTISITKNLIKSAEKNKNKIMYSSVLYGGKVIWL